MCSYDLSFICDFLYADNYNAFFRGFSGPCSAFKHILWMLNARVSLDNTLHTNNHNIA